LPNFPAQKNFTPKKILQSSPSLEYGSTPQGKHTSNTSKTVKLKCVCGSLQEAVIYKRFQLQGYDWENSGVLDKQSVMGGGCLQEVIAHGGSTLF